MLFSPLEGWRTAVEVYEMYCYTIIAGRKIELSPLKKANGN